MFILYTVSLWNSIISSKKNDFVIPSCGIRPEIKILYQGLSWHLEGQGGTQMASCMLSSHSSLTGEVSYPNTLLITGTSHSAYWFLGSSVQFPRSPLNSSSKPLTPSHGNQDLPHPLVSSKSCLPRPCWFALFSSTISVQSCMVCGILLPWGLSICD